MDWIILFIFFYSFVSVLSQRYFAIIVKTTISKAMQQTPFHAASHRRGEWPRTKRIRGILGERGRLYYYIFSSEDSEFFLKRIEEKAQLLDRHLVQWSKEDLRKSLNLWWKNTCLRRHGSCIHCPLLTWRILHPIWLYLIRKSPNCRE